MGKSEREKNLRGAGYSKKKRTVGKRKGWENREKGAMGELVGAFVWHILRGVRLSKKFLGENEI